MLRPPLPLLAVIFPLTCLFATDAHGQTSQLRKDRLQGKLDVIDAQIGNQQVQRQTEVMRLERMLRQFESRVMRLERQVLSLSRLPTITMAEAAAAVEFAEVQLRESEQLFKNGQISEVRLAADRLTLAQAKGQFDTAQAAHAESLIQLELDVLFAERHLLEQTNENMQLERLVAKGYANSSGLAYRKLDVNLAEKQLLRARERLEWQRKAAGEVESQSKAD